MRSLLIVGAGVGGLALAAALQRLSPDVSVQVVERDAGLDRAARGYSLTLDEEGLSALRALDLGEDVQRASSPVGTLRFLQPSGRVLLALAGTGPEARTSVTRAALRSLLSSRVPADRVTWGVTATRYLDPSRAAVELSDGREARADLIVVCDGARSTARQQLWRRQLSDLGLVRVEGLAPRVEHPLLDDGPSMTLGDGRSFYLQRLADGSVIWSFACLAASSSLRQLSGDELATMVQEQTKGWHEATARTVESSRHELTTVRGTYDLHPPLLRYAVGRVVLLGDAAHAMTPYRGRGANTALADAVALAEAVAEGGDPDTAVHRFEAQRLRPNSRAVESSRRTATRLHPTGVLRTSSRDCGLRAAHAALRLRPRG